MARAGWRLNGVGARQVVTRRRARGSPGYSGEMKTQTHLVTVVANLVNGDRSEWTEPLAILAKHDRLVHEGLRGKALIHELLTDDWGPPPTRVTLSCPGVDGKSIKIEISYS